MGLGLYSGKIWHASRGQLEAVVTLAAAAAVISSVTGAVAEFRGQRRRDLGIVAAMHLRAGFWNIVDTVQNRLDAREIGIAAYRVRYRWWAYERRPDRALGFGRQRYLERLHRDRPRNHNESTGLQWRPGKGVIGMCVDRGAVVSADTEDLWAAHHTLGAAGWDALPDDVRQGLTFPEFQSLRGKRLGVVIASPIFGLDSGDVLGCVAVDGPAGSPSYELLTGQRVTTTLADVALGISQALG